MLLLLGISSADEISKIQGPYSCPTNTGRDICEAFYNISYDGDSSTGNPTVKVYDEPHPHMLPLFSGMPPNNVTARDAIIDGLKGTIMNVSRFSSVDDAIHAEKALDPTFPWEFTIDEIKDEWTKFGSLDGKMIHIYAYYNRSDRGNGASGWVLISGDINELTSSADVMHVINTIHVTETKSYAKYTGEKLLPTPTIPIYDTTYKEL